LAQSEFEVGNVVSSIEAYEKSAELDAENKDLWLDWSAIYFEEGDYDQAIDLMKDGLDIFPTEAVLHYRLVVYLFVKGNYKEAFVYLENALTLNFDAYVSMYEFHPELERQTVLFKLIDQYRQQNVQ